MYMYVMWNTYNIHEHTYTFMCVMLGENGLQGNNDVRIGIIRPSHCPLQLFTSQYRLNIS